MVKKLAIISILFILISGCVPFDLVGAGNSSNGNSSNNNSNMAPTIASLLTYQPARTASNRNILSTPAQLQSNLQTHEHSPSSNPAYPSYGNHSRTDIRFHYHNPG